MHTVRKWNEVLRSERELRGWSQAKLAEAVGTDQKVVSRWERGISHPSPYFRKKLIELFGKNAVELGFVDPSVLSESSSGDDDTLPTSTLIYTHTPVSFSPIVDINLAMPFPPHPYYAHPYALQHNFTGRTHERAMLTEWLFQGREPLVALVAFGGMGKSALAWTWVQEDVLCLGERTRPAGVLWWSFYEREASFATFLNAAVTYVSCGRLNPRNLSSQYEKTQALVDLLQQQHFLLVLDGFERELRGYANRPPSIQEELVQEETHGDPRVCTDPYAGSFLRWIAAGSSVSKVLFTTRLFPRELDQVIGCRRVDVSGLDAEDAVRFCRAQGVQGTRSKIENVCQTYGYHPLAIRLLTGLIVHDPDQPGDVTVAAEYSPLPEMIQREHHILSESFDAMDPHLQQLLSRIAAFRAKVDFKMIRRISPFESGGQLKRGLRELIERGFLSFDRVRAVFDLHPVVRQYAYGRLQQKQEIHAILASHFQSICGLHLPTDQTEEGQAVGILRARSIGSGIPSQGSVESLSLLIECYHHSIGAGQFDRAFTLYAQHLANQLHHSLGAYPIIIELLQAFLDNETAFSKLDRRKQAWVLDALAQAYSATGNPEHAIHLLYDSIKIDRKLGEKERLASALWNLAVQQLELGRLAASEQSLQESIATAEEITDLFDQAKAHQYFALLRSYQGLFEEASQHLQQALFLFKSIDEVAQEGAVWAYQSLCALLAGKYPEANVSARLARDLAEVKQYERDVIRAEWLLGRTYTFLVQVENERAEDYLQQAEWHLREALTRCRHIDMVDYEADLLLAWVHLHHLRGEQQQAQSCVTEALAIVNRADFRVLRADIHNAFAVLELEDDHKREAVQHAEAALVDATCDSESYCYKKAQNEARRILNLANREWNAII
jgi:tetratricopeptide (TPR) repeat protein/transcriptional regulator with XRE-family HTH domain